MNNEKQRIIAIVNELITFLLKNKASSLSIDIKENEKETKIYVYCDLLNKEKLEELKKSIMSNRCEEIEELYWELLGETSQSRELYLLGNMIDESDIDNVDSSTVKLVLTRRKNFKRLN